MKCLDALDQSQIKSAKVYINEENNRSFEFVFFFENDVKNIIPLQGQLIIQKNLFSENEYPLVNFENTHALSLETDNRSDSEKINDAFSQCRIS